MIREKVPTRLATLRRRLGARPGSEEVAAIVESLRDHAAGERPDLLAKIVADRSHTPANRLAALALWPGGDAGHAAGEAARGGRCARRRPGARRGDPPPRQAVPARGRAAAPPRAGFARSGRARGRRRGRRGPRGLRRERARAGAARGSRSGRAPGGRVGRGHAGPEGGGRPAPRPRPRPRPGRAACRPRYAPLLRDPRALPLAVGALADRETQLPAWRASPSWAGPPRARRWPTWRSGAPPRRSSPSRCAS